jgi:hypothetical protein
LAPRRLGPARIGIGLIQGVLLYLLYTAAQDTTWPATVPLLFAPLVMLGVLLPVILSSALGHLSRRTLAGWVSTAAIAITLLAIYDIWRRLGGVDVLRPTPSGALSVCLAAGCFIAHTLVLAGARERRRIASYATYFDVAWTLGLQLAFSALFVGATWLVLQLGASLFDLIRLDFLSQAMRKAWFSIPVTAFAFASALHLTDVKPAIVRGIRNLLHVLLSWTLPVLTLLVGGFLASLPFTGLEPLWATRSAAGMLLSAAASFVVLINAAWQDGNERPARVIAVSARVASLLLAPLTLLAAYALALRVLDHGWSTDRVIAAACLLVAACYAGGYAAAALRRGWLRSLAGVNIAAAFVVLGVLALLLSPLLDPGRIAVASQLARLDTGQITLRQLDVAYLWHHGARYGRAALARLQGSTAGPDAAWLQTELARLRQPAADTGVMNPAKQLRVWPAGATLPAGFAQTNWRRTQQWARLPQCMRSQNAVCDAFVLDLGGDARPEVVVVGTDRDGDADGGVVLHQDARGAWELAASLPVMLGDCMPLFNAMRAGRLRAAPPVLADLEIDGRRIPLQNGPGHLDCTAPPVKPVD